MLLFCLLGEFQELDDDIQESYENVYPNTQPGMVQAEQFVIAYSNLAKKWLRACVSRVMEWVYTLLVGSGFCTHVVFALLIYKYMQSKKKN